MKLPRITIRRAMLGLVIAAIPLGFLARALDTRSRSRLSDAAFHTRREGEERTNLRVIDQIRCDETHIEDDRSLQLMEKASRLRVKYHAEMKQKYQRAATHPWESAPYDSGEPGNYLLLESLRVHRNVTDLLVE